MYGFVGNSEGGFIDVVKWSDFQLTTENLGVFSRQLSMSLW